MAYLIPTSLLLFDVRPSKYIVAPYMCVSPRIDDVSKLSSENVWSVNEPIDTAILYFEGIATNTGVVSNW